MEGRRGGRAGVEHIGRTEAAGKRREATAATEERGVAALTEERGVAALIERKKRKQEGSERCPGEQGKIVL